MQYIEKQGLVATKAELSALLACCADKGSLNGVGIIVRDGTLIAQASTGAAAIYHHGSTINDQGKPYEGEHEWQIGRDILATIAKTMGPTHEARFVVDKKGKMPRVRVFSIADDEQQCIADMSLDGHVSDQLAIKTMQATVPSSVPQFESTLASVLLNPNLMMIAAKAARACGAEECSVTFPDRYGSPVYFECCGIPTEDTPAPRWVLAIMQAIDLEPAAEPEEQES